MFRVEKILVAIIALSALLIGVVMVATIADLSLASGVDFSLRGPEEASESVQGASGGVVQSLQDGWRLFRSEGYAFQIQFPQQIKKKSVLNQSALNAGLGVHPEAPVWAFKLQDQELYDGTNLLEASLVIHVLRGEEEIESCSDFKARSKSWQDPDAPPSPPIVEINRVPFWVDEVEEGGMGEIYKLFSYRTVHNQACYQLTQLIHARNIDLYEEGTVEAYDQEAVIDQLDRVLRTFEFIDVKPTFPKVIYPQPKALRRSVSKAKEDQVYGLDVSHWQGDIQWPKVVDAGYIFTFVKATEGVGWTDVKFLENITEGTEAGEMMGVYHFGRPDFDHSAKEEAEYFLGEVGDYLESGYIRPVLDLEVGHGLSKTQMTNWVMEWMETVKDRSGVKPLLYTNLNFINNKLKNDVTKYDLWIAYWSCKPKPSFDIPPTGKWADWSFWQYYGPGGCGPNAGYVPGIETNIDLNIFNGVESGLLEYDAASPLWVSLTSDAYYAPKPYYADITADVNGDMTGPIDYHFWWNCPSLEAEVSSVEGSCGELPHPESGTCLENEHGMRCLDMNDELQVGEQAYPEIGDHTAKVIVERGGAQPAEDRYKIITYNPIRYTTMFPGSPAQAEIDAPFQVQAGVRVQTSLAGSVGVSLIDQASGNVIGTKCKAVGADVKAIKTFNFTLPVSPLGKRTYTVYTRYRVEDDCPIEDVHPDDYSQSYVIQWIEPQPVLDLQRPAGTSIPADGTDDVGEVMVHLGRELSYDLLNPSPSTSINISEITFENQDNVSDLGVESSLPIVVAPEDINNAPLSFQVDSTGAFSFDMLLEHDGINPSPYRITVEGQGVEHLDPLQSLNLDPSPSGSALMGEEFKLDADVHANIPADGILQASVVGSGSRSVRDLACRSVSADTQGMESFQLAWSESAAGDKDYTVWARYRVDGSCPIEDAAAEDLSQPYQVSWQEDPPALEMEGPDGTSLVAGSVDHMGEVEFYGTVTRDYVVRNPSVTSPLEITSIGAAHLSNLSEVKVSPPGPLVLDAGERRSISVTFPVENTGAFSFDLELAHDGTNPSPYRLTVQGQGSMDTDPIQSVELLPSSPDEIYIGKDFALDVNVGVNIPAAGALQVDVARQGSGSAVDTACQALKEGQQSTKSYDLSWTESVPGEVPYDVRVRYRAGGGCPLGEGADAQRTASYTVDWVDDPPTLEVQSPSGTTLSPGDVDQLGEFEFYQSLTLTYTLRNPSVTTGLRVSEVSAEDLDHLADVEISPSGPFEISPGKSAQVSVSFRVENTGPFSFELAFGHDAGNASPYVIAVEGSGKMTDNPIQFITPDPLSPGSALIGETFQLDVQVGYDVPDQGVLEVRLMEVDGGEVMDESCHAVGGDLQASKVIRLAWSDADPSTIDYQILAEYQTRGSCPLREDPDAERVQEYQVTWREIAPELEIERADGTVIPAGGSDSLGGTPFGQPQEITYVIRNTSSTTGMEVSDVIGANQENLSAWDVEPGAPFTLGPGEAKEVTISTTAGDLGPYGFDLVIDHGTSNASPYQITVQGRSELVGNPIQSLQPKPPSPGSAWIGDTYTVEVEAVVDSPADSALLVSLIEKGSGEVKTGQCMNIQGQGRATGTVELSWTESSPGEVEYELHARYQALEGCPLSEGQDALLKENYRVIWQEEIPELVVRRPEGVTIFDGSEDYVGVHDWFMFVEATYMLENTSRTTALRVEDISAAHLTNLRRVKVSPSAPFEIGPGGSKTIKVLFLVLDLEPFRFDLTVDHNGSGAQPYNFSVHGDANLNLERFDLKSRFHGPIEDMIEHGVFMRLPGFMLDILEGYLER